MYISKNKKSPNLLSESACLDLGLITYAPGGRFIRSTRQTRPEGNLPRIVGLQPEQERRVDQFHKEFTHVYQGLGCLKGFQARLELLPNAKDFFIRGAPVALHLHETGSARARELVRTKVWLEHDTNLPVRCCSRLLVLEKPKQPNDCRFVGDYVFLNKYLARTSYVPALRVEQMLDKLRGAKHFLKCDLNQG